VAEADTVDFAKITLKYDPFADRELQDCMQKVCFFLSGTEKVCLLVIWGPFANVLGRLLSLHISPRTRSYHR